MKIDRILSVLRSLKEWSKVKRITEKYASHF